MPPSQPQIVGSNFNSLPPPLELLHSSQVLVIDRNGQAIPRSASQVIIPVNGQVLPSGQIQFTDQNGQVVPQHAGQVFIPNQGQADQNRGFFKNLKKIGEGVGGILVENTLPGQIAQEIFNLRSEGNVPIGQSQAPLSGKLSNINRIGQIIHEDSLPPAVGHVIDPIIRTESNAILSNSAQ